MALKLSITSVKVLYTNTGDTLPRKQGAHSPLPPPGPRGTGVPASLHSCPFRWVSSVTNLEQSCSLLSRVRTHFLVFSLLWVAFGGTVMTGCGERWRGDGNAPGCVPSGLSSRPAGTCRGRCPTRSAGLSPVRAPWVWSTPREGPGDWRSGSPDRGTAGGSSPLAPPPPSPRPRPPARTHSLARWPKVYRATWLATSTMRLM